MKIVLLQFVLLHGAFSATQDATNPEEVSNRNEQFSIHQQQQHGTRSLRKKLRKKQLKSMDSEDESFDEFDEECDKEEDKCEEYCVLFTQAQSRCPAAATGSIRSIEDCKIECLDANFSKEGTEQDFLLQDTIQCRQNHALMAIKEGVLTNSYHCIHASIDAPGRCVHDAESVALTQRLSTGKYLFNNILDSLTDPPEVLAGKFFLAISYLIAMRGRLYTTYPNAKVIDTAEEQQSCYDDLSKQKYRTADGSCNNMNMPIMGATNTPFVHNLQSSPKHPEGYADVEKVAQTIKRPDDGNEDPSRVAPFSQLATAWIQFMTHDWFAHDIHETKKPMRNRVTHWWDASQLYGSSPEEMSRVRTPAGGKLHLDKNNEIDYDKKNMPITGFGENFWVGLHVMHTIFAREHNYIVDELRSTYNTMTDDELFHTARLCVAAILAKIHTVEWTPTLLPNPISTFGIYSNWYGLSATAQKFFSPETLTSYKDVIESIKAPHFGDEEGYTTDVTLFNTSFFMTEEFVAVYRMHPLLPDYLSVNGRKLRLQQLVFKDARKLVKQNTTLTFLDALTKAPARTISLKNYPFELYNIRVPDRKGTINLAEIDILRDRERDIPRYNDARRQLLLEPYTTFDDLTDDPEEKELLESVYSDVDQVDFMVGCLVDKDRPQGFAFGIVPFHIFLVMASRRIFSDRFFQESFTSEYYTEWGINYVHSTNFSQIIKRHYPELENSLPHNPFDNRY